MHTLRREYDIPRHTYAPREMSAAAVEEVVLRPYRFERNMQEPAVRPTSTRVLTTRVVHDEVPIVGTNILADNDHSCTCVTVIRGGNLHSSTTLTQFSNILLSCSKDASLSLVAHIIIKDG